MSIAMTLCCHTVDCQHWAAARQSTLSPFNIALGLTRFFSFLSSVFSFFLVQFLSALYPFPFSTCHCLSLSSFPLSCPFLFFSRCGLSGGFGVPQGLGYALLDQLHYLNHHPSHCGSEPLGCRWPAHRGHHVRRWPPKSLCPWRVSEVRMIISFILYIHLNKIVIYQDIFRIHIIYFYFFLQPNVLDQLERAVSQYYACHTHWCQCTCDHWHWHPNP